MEKLDREHEGKPVYRNKTDSGNRIYYTDRECKYCGDEFKAELGNVRKGYGNYCSHKCSGKHQAEQEDRTGENHHQWKGKKKKREYIDNYKNDRECKYCDEDREPCLQLHHKNPDKKVSSISEMRSSEHTLDEVKKEIDKCEVVCANCHWIKHSKNYEL